MEKKFYDWSWSDVDAVVYAVAKDEPVCEGVKEIYAALKEKGMFEEKAGEMVASMYQRDGKICDVVFVGGAEKVDKKFINGLAKAYKYLKGRKAVKIGFNFKNVVDEDKKFSRVLGELFTMTDYIFDDYKTEKKESTVKEIYFKNYDYDEKLYKEGEVLGEQNVFARKLVNEPANVMNPAKLAKYAKEEGEKYGVEVDIKDRPEIEKYGMGSYLAVASASANDPKLIIMRYKGNPSSKDVLGFVGKGITFDSGGLSLKPSDGMKTMKCDMGGAAAVISAIIGVARLGLPINVTAVVASTDNMVSGTSDRPGDIVYSMAGKSIFIDNTDAEGRLTLVDAVTFVLQEEKATKLVDVATLTGAAIRALGNTVTASVSNNDELFGKVENCFHDMNENIWRMPLFDDYREDLKHSWADIKNIAAPGMQGAALFIEAFVGDTPWVHLDIAGPAFADKAANIHGDGATGAAVRPLIELAKKL